MNGLEQRDLLGGGTYLKLHHYADPGKGQEWLDAIRAETPERQFRREYLMDESVHEGDPVYPEFDYALHCPELFRRQIPPLIRGAVLYGGWDIGTSLAPAFSLAQV